MQALPEFPPGEGETRPMTFRKVLLNTCQEEFEGTHAAREVSSPPCSYESLWLHVLVTSSVICPTVGSILSLRTKARHS